jgi:tetratricopeptide (TPR) repeat protein
MSAILIDQAREALQLAESDPSRALTLASALTRQAREARDHAAASVAERAVGLAALHSQDLDTAMRHLRTAIALGRRAGSPQLAAQARMTLAFAASSRGWSRRALREIDTALLDLRGADHARGQAQRAAILQQLGRLDEALASLCAALPVLRSAGDQMWTWRVLSNRGVVHGWRLELADAAADLREAARLCDALGLDQSTAYVRQNLGWVHALGGDVPLALHYLDSAERGLRRLGSQLGAVLRDRSELLLSVYLVSEARDVAQAAVRELERERRHIILPEVRLLLARAALLDGDAPQALHQSRRAVREFVSQHRPEWTVLARLAVCAAQLSGADRARVGVRQLARIADALEATRWTVTATEARIMAAQLAFDRGSTSLARRLLRLAGKVRRHAPATLRARAWYATALLRLDTGDRRGALSAARTGLRIVDEYRAAFGATDLRARAAGHRTDLAELGLRVCLQGGRAPRVLEWAERGRASHLLFRPARPPDDPLLGAALAELRAAAAEVVELRRAERSPSKAMARVVALERRIRDHCRQQPGSAQQAEPVPLDALVARLGDAALIEFILLDQQLHAVSVAGGRVRLHRLGPVAPVRELVDRVPFALRRLGRGRSSAASRQAAVDLLRDAAARLDATLLAPLSRGLDGAPLVVVPTGPLQSLPWSILPTCAGRPVTVAPSAAAWYLAGAGPAVPTGSVAVVAGPDLPGAHSEAEAVAAIHGVAALTGAAPTTGATSSALRRADLAHLAAHGRLSAENPLFSSLALANGPLMVYDLERLDRVPPTVVLAACDSGRHVVCAGDELLGLAATFLAQGTQQLVASVIPVPDAETAPLMVALHQLLATGQPVAHALASAQRLLADESPATMAAAAGFVCIGAGLTRPPRQPAHALSIRVPRQATGEVPSAGLGTRCHE